MLINPIIPVLLAMFIICFVYIFGIISFHLLNLHNSFYLNKYRRNIYPLLSISIILLITQNLLYLNVPSNLSIFVISSMFLFLLIKNVRKQLFVFAKIDVLLSISLYLLILSPILINGIDNYYGQGWGDLLNYLSTSENLKHLPFSVTDFSSEAEYIGNHYKVEDRIGVQIVMAFFASLFNLNSQTIYPFVLLLSPVLIFNFFCISHNILFVKKISYLLAFVLSFSVSILTLFFECFLSQFFVLPFFYFLFIAGFLLIQKKISYREILFSSLILSSITSIYQEFLIIGIGILSVCFLYNFYFFNILRFGNHLTKVNLIKLFTFHKKIILVILLSIILNIFYLDDILRLFYTRVAAVTPETLKDIYPWSFDPLGIHYAIIGNINNNGDNLIFLSIFIFTTCFTFIITSLVKEKKFYRYGVAPVLFTLTIPIIFFILHIFDVSYFYVNYKLLLTLFPIFLYLGFYCFPSSLSYVKIFLISCLLIVNYYSIYFSTTFNASFDSKRGGSYLLNNAFTDAKSFIILYEKNNPNFNLYNWWNDNLLNNGEYINNWFNYYFDKQNYWSIYKISYHDIHQTSKIPLKIIDNHNVSLGISNFFIPNYKMLRSFKKDFGNSHLTFYIYEFLSNDEIKNFDKAVREKLFDNIMK